LVLNFGTVTNVKAAQVPITNVVVAINPNTITVSDSGIWWTKKEAERRVDRAVRINATFAAPSLMRHTLPPLRSNELFGTGISLV